MTQVYILAIDLAKRSFQVCGTDRISEGELVYVSDGTEDGTKGLTENGIEELQSLLADIRTWDGGIREFLIDTQCDPEMIDRIHGRRDETRL